MPREQNLRLLIEVSKLYYEEQLAQAQIAQRLGLSRSKISRLLTEAREQGLVKIIVCNPFDDITFLENQLLSIFPLKALRVVPTSTLDDSFIKQVTANEAASFITRFLNKNDHIGVSWGITLYELAKSFPSLPLPGTMVVQLNGGIDDANTHNHANDIVQILARKLEARAYILPCPAMVDNPTIREALLQDAKLRNVLQMGRDCNKVLVSIGVPGPASCLAQAGYLSREDIMQLRKKGAVGSICSRFYDINGNICDKDLDERTLGVSLKHIKQANCVIGCAAGLGKAPALLGALHGGYLDVLVVDSVTAREVIELAAENESNREVTSAILSAL